MVLKLIFFSFLSIICFIVNAQDVKLLTVDQLENRFKNGKDTVFVVNFWATWCTPCVAELPYFEKLQVNYKMHPLKVLLVSVDAKSRLENTVKPFVKRNKLRSEVVVLNEKSQQIYIDRISKEWSGALPATLVVNSHKNIRNFYEHPFTYPELEEISQTLK